jgi:hypothetical protein
MGALTNSAEVILAISQLRDAAVAMEMELDDVRAVSTGERPEASRLPFAPRNRRSTARAGGGGAGAGGEAAPRLNLAEQRKEALAFEEDAAPARTSAGNLVAALAQAAAPAAPPGQKPRRRRRRSRQQRNVAPEDESDAPHGMIVGGGKVGAKKSAKAAGAKKSAKGAKGTTYKGARKGTKGTTAKGTADVAHTSPAAAANAAAAAALMGINLDEGSDDDDDDVDYYTSDDLQGGDAQLALQRGRAVLMGAAQKLGALLNDPSTSTQALREGIAELLAAADAGAPSAHDDGTVTTLLAQLVSEAEAVLAGRIERDEARLRAAPATVKPVAATTAATAAAGKRVSGTHSIGGGSSVGVSDNEFLSGDLEPVDLAGGIVDADATPATILRYLAAVPVTPLPAAISGLLECTTALARHAHAFSSDALTRLGTLESTVSLIKSDHDEMLILHERASEIFSVHHEALGMSDGAGGGAAGGGAASGPAAPLGRAPPWERSGDSRGNPLRPPIPGVDDWHGENGAGPGGAGNTGGGSSGGGRGIVGSSAQTVGLAAGVQRVGKMLAELRNGVRALRREVGGKASRGEVERVRKALEIGVERGLVGSAAEIGPDGTIVRRRPAPIVDRCLSCDRPAPDYVERVTAGTMVGTDDGAGTAAGADPGAQYGKGGKAHHGPRTKKASAAGSWPPGAVTPMIHSPGFPSKQRHFTSPPRLHLQRSSFREMTVEADTRLLGINSNSHEQPTAGAMLNAVVGGLPVLASPHSRSAASAALIATESSPRPPRAQSSSGKRRKRRVRPSTAPDERAARQEQEQEQERLYSTAALMGGGGGGSSDDGHDSDNNPGPELSPEALALAAAPTAAVATAPAVAMAAPPRPTPIPPRPRSRLGPGAIGAGSRPPPA